MILYLNKIREAMLENKGDCMPTSIMEHSGGSTAWALAQTLVKKISILWVSLGQN
jgi:hypothetical protein